MKTGLVRKEKPSFVRVASPTRASELIDLALELGEAAVRPKDAKKRQEVKQISAQFPWDDKPGWYPVVDLAILSEPPAFRTVYLVASLTGKRNAA